MSARVFLPLGAVALLAATACSDSTAPVTPVPRSQQALTGNTITVASAAELVAALSPENTGRRILVRAGTYDIDRLLIVPDGVALEGEGRMLSDAAGLPVGFGTGVRTTLRMAVNVPGDMLTLGNGVTIQRLEIVDLAGRGGNVVAVYSRAPGDRVAAAILESDIVNPNAGYGLMVQTRNLNAGADPPPHGGATISARMAHSRIQSPAMGGGGVFAFNFAPLGKVAVALTGNVIGTFATNALNANGGVSLPDVVHDSQVWIHSQGNLYRRLASDLCAPAGSSPPGWNLVGGSGPPVQVAASETARNTLRVHSQSDRIEGFKTAVLATGSRRFFGSPLVGPSTDNALDLELIGATLSTPSCGGDPMVRDLNLIGAFAANNTFAPGEGNTLRAVIRQVTGSGPRFNQYADEGGPFGSLPGAGNRLEIAGNAQSFARTNRSIDPAPPPQFFRGGQP